MILKLTIATVYLSLLFIGLYFLFSVIDFKDLTSYDFIRSNKDIILQKIKRSQDILDRHHGLLLYAKKSHGFDLTKILNDWYSDQNWEGHEIMKAYNGPDEND